MSSTGLIELPKWYTDSREEALGRFKDLPAPHYKDERWRFSNTKLFQFEEAPEQLPVEPSQRELALSRSTRLREPGGKAVFANGELIHNEPISQELRDQGVIWLPLEEALSRHPDLLEKYYMDQGAPLGSEKFAALHYAMGQSGTFLYVPKNVEVELPLEAFHFKCGNNGAIYPHTLIVAERFAKVTLVDYYNSLDHSATGYACPVTDLYAGEGAKVNYVAIQNFGLGVVANQINSTQVAKDGHAKSMIVNLGGQYVRSESFSRMTGEGGRSDMLAISAAEKTQVYDMRTLQEHQKGHTTSDLLYKNTLNDESKTVFSGLIKVDEGAHQTDAYQTVRNLILDERAEADSMPGLEILADEVKCSHGATTGQIDEEELFYLLARGIPEKQAKQLVVAGFLLEAVQRLELPKVEEQIQNQILEFFQTLE
jgi:Fe-S cluster assembly protein SufD